jgi:hypothetical protein
VIVPLLIFVLCFAGFWAMMCRINQMSRHTLDAVAWQHIQLATGFAATPVAWYLGGPVEGQMWALLTILVSVVAYVLIGSVRWRDGAPIGTRKDDHGGGVSHQRGVSPHRPAWQRMHQDGPGRDGGLLRSAQVHTNRNGAP